MEQIVHTSAGRGVSGFRKSSRFFLETWYVEAEQIADIPVPSGLRHDFFQILIRQLSLQISLESRMKGVFRTLPRFLFFKVRQLLLARGRGCRRTRAHPRPHGADFYVDDTENVWVQLDTGLWRMLNTDIPI